MPEELPDGPQEQTGTDSAEAAAPPRRRARVWLRRMVVLLLAYVGLSYAAAWYVFHPVTWPVKVPKLLEDTPPQDVAFQSADGTLLSAWWFEATDAHATVIVCHGAFENRVAMSDCVPHLLRGGLNVLTPDFRARGKSGGEMSTLGRKEAQDVLAAVEWVTEQPQAKALPVGLMGFSQGAAAAIMAAPQSDAVAAVVADSPYATLKQAVDRHVRVVLGPFAGTLGWPFYQFGLRMAGFDPNTVRPVDSIGDVAPRPILLIHGGDDFMIGPENSQELQQAAGENASLWIVPDARHTKARKKDPEEYWRRVMGFWEEALPASGEPQTANRTEAPLAPSAQ